MTDSKNVSWKWAIGGYIKPSSQKGRRIERFGYNLGYGARPWMVKYGAAWQFKLADAIVYSKGPKYEGINVPRSREMHRAATEFLYLNKRLIGGRENLSDRAYQSRTGHLHHTLLDKTWADTYRFKVVYGNRKIIDPNIRSTIQKLNEEIRYASPRDKKKLKALKTELEKKNTYKQWQVEAAKAGVITTVANPAYKQSVASAESLIKDRNIAKIKLQMAKLEIKNDMKFDSTYDFRNAGVAIGSGSDLNKKEESDLRRLVEYLLRARWIKLSVWKGIMAPGRDRVRRYLYTHLGARKYREFFLSYNAQLKYATSAYFVPGSEYGNMRPAYDNRKGNLSPLQRRRGFDKSGKEYIKRFKGD